MVTLGCGSLAHLIMAISGKVDEQEEGGRVYSVTHQRVT